MVLFEFPGANGHVARCRIPTAAVIHYGVFRILLGSSGISNISEISNITQKYIDVTPTGTVDWTSVEYPSYTEAEKEAYYRDAQWAEQDTDPLAK